MYNSREPKLTIEINNFDDHLNNYKLIMNSLKEYIQNNSDTQKIIDNFDNFFNADNIIKGDELTLLNLAKLLLFMTSLSSKKEKHFSILTSLEKNFENEFILSCEFFQLKSINEIIQISGNDKNINKNNIINPNNDGILQVSEIFFFLSGGDFLKKKIDILDETIIKNSEMYNSILDKTEKKMAELKQNLSDLESMNNEKGTEIEQLKKKLDELNNQLNKKNEENTQLKKLFDDLKAQKEKEMSEYKKQIKDITDLKDQEITLLNNKIRAEQNNQNEKASNLEQDFERFKITSNKMNQELTQQNEELKKQVDNIPLLHQEIDKLKNYFEESENEKENMKNEILMYQEKIKNNEKINFEMSEKINILEQKLQSDPYFAREIMSKTLYDFALKMMSENN